MTPPNPQGFTVWFTGLPCAGKTSLASALFRKLKVIRISATCLDGDVLRKTLSKDLGFSKKDRETHVLRVAAAASRLTQNGVVTLVSLISPYRKTRLRARRMIGDFVEVYVRCPLKVCEKRDVKGHYKLARQGQLRHFTGVSDPYEEPRTPEVTLRTDETDLDYCARRVMNYLENSGWIPSPCKHRPLCRRPARKLRSQNLFPNV